MAVYAVYVFRVITIEISSFERLNIYNISVYIDTNVCIFLRSVKIYRQKKCTITMLKCEYGYICVSRFEIDTLDNYLG